ncbi:hypothetical protein DA792_03840 [Celeribacter baekdonensis]|uniref:Uncharacterized protein n=1 Tax=Celeribacter baekdonensis TaxID=875171 RepID=A0A2R4LZF9_9RHOB|nr:hypothetical protein DA792_03840 [Celeribacter baekdonensis]
MSRVVMKVGPLSGAVLIFAVFVIFLFGRRNGGPEGQRSWRRVLPGEDRRGKALFYGILVQTAFGGGFAKGLFKPDSEVPGLQSVCKAWH